MKTLLVITMLSFLAFGCASKETKSEVREKAQNSKVKSPENLKNAIESALAKSSHLSEEQRAEIGKILSANKTLADELAEKSYQFRGILIQELLSENMDSKKVKYIEKNIKDIEGRRLQNTLETISKISGIVSKSPDRRNFSEPLMGFEQFR